MSPLDSYQQIVLKELGNKTKVELQKIVYQSQRGTWDSIKHTCPTRGEALVQATLIRFAELEKPDRPPKEGHTWKRNLMSGRWMEIADGTPLCCDPSSETYWSM